jgi:hypothetical protein
MPLPTCWCVFRLPPGVGERIEATFRDEVVGAFPELSDDARWDRGLRQATAAWTVDVTAGLLSRAAASDTPMHLIRRPVAGVRQVLRYRWEEMSKLEEFPALVETVGVLLKVLADGWEPAPLPGYPAFARHDSAQVRGSS